MIDKLSKADLVTKKIDWLDFGASKAASLEYGNRHLGGQRGLGIDLDEERVALMNRSGYDGVVADLTKLKLPAKSVKFTKMAHILEHMPDLPAVETVIKTAAAASTDFLLITGPFFDEEDYLKSQGFKLHWSDYADHPCHLKVSQLVSLLDRLKLKDYEIYLRYPIVDSSHHHIHPLASPTQSHRYDPKIHPPKKQLAFDKLIWTDFVCYVRLGRLKNWPAITEAYGHQIPYIFSQNGRRVAMPEAMLRRLVASDLQAQAGEERLQQLKTKVQVLQSKAAAADRQRRQLAGSKAHKTVRQLQRAAFAARHPAKAIKKVSRRV